MSEKSKSFEYTYSASEQAEIKKIREKYETPKEPDKMEQLRRLDAGVTKKGTIVSLAVGIVGALVLGLGMSFTMTTLGQAWGIAGIAAMVIGCVVGTVGIVLICLAYPLYSRITAKERERIAPEILRLTDELMK